MRATQIEMSQHRGVSRQHNEQKSNKIRSLIDDKLINT